MRAGVRSGLAIVLIVCATLIGAAFAVMQSPDLTTDATDTSPTAPPAPLDAATVIFGAVGDFDNKAPNYVDMVALAKRLGNRGGMFLLALGDLGYVADEQQWCGKIKSAFNTTLVVAGNHDTTESGPGDINNDVVYCPFNVDADLVPGPTYGYGKSFYFDYPRAAPLVRVIMITAGTTGTQVSGQNYGSGGKEYNWVVSAVNDGRTAGIPWVVVGLHKMCITVGTKSSCEMGQAIFDKLVDLKVDLILQGHDHVYERSKQLALSTNCPTVPSAGHFDADCVVASGPNFTKGDGTIVAVDGAGGRDLYTVHIDGSDPEIGYFDEVMGTNANTQGKSNGHGSLAVTLNATTLTGQTTFCPLGSGDPTTGECPSKVPTTFSDSFTIFSGDVPPPALGADFSFSPSSPVTGQSVTFTASASGGTPPYSYAWEFGDGGTGSGATATHAYESPGSYAVNLTVTDAASGSASASHPVTVSSPPPLTAEFTFSPSQPRAGDAVTFTASASGGSPPYSYAWGFGDGAQGSGATVTHTYAAAGSYLATLTVSDASSDTATASHTVVVSAPPPLAADFTFSPTDPQPGQSVTFTASASGGTPPYSYAWQFGDGATGSGATASHTYATAGSYVANLTVTDSASGTALASRTVVVSPPPPPGSPVAAFTVSPAWPQVNATVAFDASTSTDPNPNATLEYRWDWTDDGTWDTAWSTAPTATHAYPAAGEQVARLEVRNDAGLSDSATAFVPVDGSPPTTALSLSGVAGQNGWYRGSVTVTLTATDDLSGVATTRYRRDNASWSQGTSTTFTNDRVHSLDFYSTDRSGLVEPTHTSSIPIDQTVPTTAYALLGTQNQDGSYRDSVNLTFTASDGLSGVDAVSYRIGDGAWQTYTSRILISGAGSYVVTYFAADVAGNIAPTGSVSFTISGSSPSPPGSPPVTTLSLTGSQGAGGWYVSSTTATLSATSPEGLGVTVYYRWDQGPWTRYTAPFVVPEGVHMLEYNGTDAASRREAVQSATVSVDTRAPTTTSDAVGTRGRDHWFTTPVTVTLAGGDASSGVAVTRYRLDAAAWQTYAGSFVVADGRHVLEYGSTDAAGNAEVAVVLSIRVDSTPPRIRLNEVPAILTIPDVSLAWNATDGVAGVVENSLSLDGASYVSLGNASRASLSLADGPHTLRVLVVDDAGNAAVAELSLRVDTNPFSPTGPYGGVPLFLLLAAVAFVLVILAGRRGARRRRRAQAQQRYRRRGA